MRSSRNQLARSGSPGRLRRASTVGLVAGAAMMLAGCDDGTTLVGVAAGGNGLAVAVGTGGVTPGATTAQALVGRWTRVEVGAGGTTSELTFTFAADGSGGRATVLRSALGGAIAADVQPFAWSGGGGLVLLRFPAPGGVGETLVRASYRVDQGLTGTTLVLDGLTFARAGG